MKTFNPNNTDHTFKIVPRVYLDPDYMCFKSEFSSEEEEVIISNFVINSYISIDFSKVMQEEEKGEITIKSNGEVIYRGAYISTSQNIEDYDLSTDTYTYYEG